MWKNKDVNVIISIKWEKRLWCCRYSTAIATVYFTVYLIEPIEQRREVSDPTPSLRKSACIIYGTMSLLETIAVSLWPNILIGNLRRTSCWPSVAVALCRVVFRVVHRCALQRPASDWNGRTARLWVKSFAVNSFHFSTPHDVRELRICAFTSQQLL